MSVTLISPSTLQTGVPAGFEPSQVRMSAIKGDPRALEGKVRAFVQMKEDARDLMRSRSGEMLKQLVAIEYKH